MPSGETPFQQDYAEYDPDARPLEAIKVPKRPGLPYLQQPSKWTCLPTSFTMVLSKEDHSKAGGLFLSIMNQLGRDDERGFHVQEFLGIAVTLRIAFIPFEFEPEVDRAPCSAANCESGMVQFPSFDSQAWAQCASCKGTGLLTSAPLVVWPIQDLMLKHDGVLVGKRKDAEHYHAVAWCRETQLCLDPELGIYGLDGFEPMTFWAAFRLGDQFASVL